MRDTMTESYLSFQIYPNFSTEYVHHRVEKKRYKQLPAKTMDQNHLCQSRLTHTNTVITVFPFSFPVIEFNEDDDDNNNNDNNRTQHT